MESQSRSSPSSASAHSATSAVVASSVSAAELSQLLVEIVTSLCRSSFRSQDWRGVVDLYVDPLQRMVDITALNMTVRLAAAVSLVGAEQARRFDLCIEWLAASKEMKGPYWLTQEELLRHFVLSAMRSRISDLSPTTRLSELLGVRLCTLYLEDKEMLRLMLPIKRELDNLLRDVVRAKTTVERERIIDNFEVRTPLSSFCTWFTKLALEKLTSAMATRSWRSTATQTDSLSVCVTPPRERLSQLSLSEGESNDDSLAQEEGTTQQSSPVALLDVIHTVAKFVNP